MTLRQAKDTAISHNAIIELQEDEHNGFAHTVWKGVFHQLPKEYLDREFKPITDYVHYEKQYESPIIIELKALSKVYNVLNKNVFIRVERLKKRKVYTNIKDRIMTKEEYQKKDF